MRQERSVRPSLEAILRHLAQNRNSIEQNSIPQIDDILTSSLSTHTSAVRGMYTEPHKIPGLELFLDAHSILNLSKVADKNSTNYAIFCARFLARSCVDRKAKPKSSAPETPSTVETDITERFGKINLVDSSDLNKSTVDAGKSLSALKWPTVEPEEKAVITVALQDKKESVGQNKDDPIKNGLALFKNILKYLFKECVPLLENPTKSKKPPPSDDLKKAVAELAFLLADAPHFPALKNTWDKLGYNLYPPLQRIVTELMLGGLPADVNDLTPCLRESAILDALLQIIFLTSFHPIIVKVILQMLETTFPECNTALLRTTLIIRYLAGAFFSNNISHFKKEKNKLIVEKILNNLDFETRNITVQSLLLYGCMVLTEESDFINYVNNYIEKLLTPSFVILLVQFLPEVASTTLNTLVKPTNVIDFLISLVGIEAPTVLMTLLENTLSSQLSEAREKARTQKGEERKFRRAIQKLGADGFTFLRDFFPEYFSNKRSPQPQEIIASPPSQTLVSPPSHDVLPHRATDFSKSLSNPCFRVGSPEKTPPISWFENRVTTSSDGIFPIEGTDHYLLFHPNVLKDSQNLLKPHQRFATTGPHGKGLKRLMSTRPPLYEYKLTPTDKKRWLVVEVKPNLYWAFEYTAQGFEYSDLENVMNILYKATNSLEQYLAEQKPAPSFASDLEKILRNKNVISFKGINCTRLIAELNTLPRHDNSTQIIEALETIITSKKLIPYFEPAFTTPENFTDSFEFTLDLMGLVLAHGPHNSLESLLQAFYRALKEIKKNKCSLEKISAFLRETSKNDLSTTIARFVLNCHHSKNPKKPSDILASESTSLIRLWLKYLVNNPEASPEQSVIIRAVKSLDGQPIKQTTFARHLLLKGKNPPKKTFSDLFKVIRPEHYAAKENLKLFRALIAIFHVLGNIPGLKATLSLMLKKIQEDPKSYRDLKNDLESVKNSNDPETPLFAAALEALESGPTATPPSNLTPNFPS